MIRRAIAIVIIAMTVVGVSPAPAAMFGGASAADASVMQPAGAVPDDAGHSIGSPDAGPKPEQSGDRGGSAQLTLLALLIVAVSFVMWKIFHGARGGRPL